MKTPEQYKQDFLKRASTGYLLKIWRVNTYYGYYEDYDENRGVIVEDVVWSRECDVRKYHKWTKEEFKKILASKPHFKRKSKVKRQELATKNKHGRSSHKK